MSFVRCCFTLKFIILFCCFEAGIVARKAAGQEKEKEDNIPLEAPEGWRGETINVPPAFAKDMKLKGVEKIRFAPGMFKPDADGFFSYVLVFRLETEPELNKEVLERELLAYYRGLAEAVGRGKIKTDGFSISVTAKEDEASREEGVNHYNAKLKWIEPFATSKEQTLNFELRSWKSEKTEHNWVFMAVSPNGADDPIWKTMHQIRDEFIEAVNKQ